MQVLQCTIKVLCKGTDLGQMQSEVINDRLVTRVAPGEGTDGHRVLFGSAILTFIRRFYLVLKRLATKMQKLQSRASS